MPKKKLYLQISFEQGMIDTVVEDYDYQDSDLKWQAPQSRSALYIENYDPNIVRSALTKRYGYGLLRTQGNDITGDVGLYDKNNLDPADPAGYPPNYNATYINAVQLDRFTTLIDIDPDPGLTPGFGVSGSDAITVCGAMAMPHNKPVGQALLLFFLRDIVDNTLSGGDVEERTRIVHYGKHQDAAVSNDATWRNAHINTGNPGSGTIRGSLYPAVYPGWDIRGTFSGAARHGGNLVVTSNVAYEYRPWSTTAFGGTNFEWTSDWVEQMYPCYVWTYWDYRRKRNKRKFWQITNDGSNTVTVLNDLTDNYTGDDKYSHFKVLYPSPKVTRDTTFVTWRAYTTQGKVVADATMADTSDLQYAVAQDSITTKFLDSAPINSAVEVSILELRGREFSSAYVPYDEDTIKSQTDELVVTKEYPYLNKYLSHIATVEIPKSYDIAAQDNEYWKIATRRDLNNVINNIEIVNGTISYGSYVNNTSIVAYTLESRVKNSAGQRLDQHVGNGKSGDDKLELKEPFYWTVGIKLPNYLESNAPRPWLKGEKIPLLLTATIRGAEVLIGRHVHTVQMEDYDPYPSMWWPTATIRYDLTLGNTGTIPYEYSTDDLAIESLGPLVSVEAVREQYYIAKDNTVRFNGRILLSAYVRGFALGADTDITYPPNANGNRVYYKHYKSYKPYCIEPFNPTTNDPYVAKTGDYTIPTDEWARQCFYHRPIDTAVNVGMTGQPWIRDNGKSGYRTDHVNPKLIMLTIKIAKEHFSDVFEQGIESFNLYCAQPSTESAFHSIGLYSVQEPQQGIYMLPEIPAQTELNQYRLVKRYVLDGDGSPYYNFRTTQEKNYWKEFYTGAPIATNSWVEKGPDASTGFLVATGQHADDDNTGSSASRELTPDFILWDYPISTTLSLNSSGQYWQGRGAGIVTNIKGRTFIGQCIDQYGDEEQATVRYSDVQSGVITLDLFSEENYLKIGGLPHTAITEYREQMWVFNASEVHRIQLPDVVNQTTWEYLDKIPGQGTYNQKTVITTPQGVVWANEGGVWISDGRMPENLAEPVLTFYKMMATNAPPYYSTKITLPQFPFDEYGRNPYLEVAYDEFKDELVICSPAMAVLNEFNDYGGQPNQCPEQEYRLVFSFGAKTWHVQHADLPVFGSFLNEFDQNGKVTF